MRPRPYLLNVQYDTSKYSLPLHGRQWVQLHSRIDSIRSNTKFSKKLLDWLHTKKVKNFDFLSFPFSKTLREFRKPKFKIGDGVRISKYYLFFRKDCKPQFTKKVSKIVAISTRKPPANTIIDEQDEIIRGKFCQKELIKVT